MSNEKNKYEVNTIIDYTVLITLLEGDTKDALEMLEFAEFCKKTNAPVFIGTTANHFFHACYKADPSKVDFKRMQRVLEAVKICLPDANDKIKVYDYKDEEGIKKELIFFANSFSKEDNCHPDRGLKK